VGKGCKQEEELRCQEKGVLEEGGSNQEDNLGAGQDLTFASSFPTPSSPRSLLLELLLSFQSFNLSRDRGRSLQPSKRLQRGVEMMTRTSRRCPTPCRSDARHCFTIAPPHPLLAARTAPMHRAGFFDDVGLFPSRLRKPREPSAFADVLSGYRVRSSRRSQMLSGMILRDWSRPRR